MRDRKKQYALMLIYAENKVVSYDVIESKIVLTLERLLVEHEKNS